MSPREETPLVKGRAPLPSKLSLDNDDSTSPARSTQQCLYSVRRRPVCFVITLLAVTLLVSTVFWHDARLSGPSAEQEATGPYTLVERQVGQSFLSYYDFYDGADSLGSAGYNIYVSKQRAQDLGLVMVDKDSEDVTIQSSPTDKGPRESIRLEGKRRFNRGLFLLDVTHIPTGCGLWPAFWLTDDDEGQWPDHGEIDIVEGVNTLSSAKTALHTSGSCSMYAHVPTWAHTGVWDRASGIPDTWTGALDMNTSVPADNCWSMAPHQWANQGCVMTESRPNTIGAGFNKNGGGVYALEWDPVSGYIKSWVWNQDEIPANLKDAMISSDYKQGKVDPDPSTWNTPYAYFAIGKDSGCSADHFQNHHIVFNLAFCGTVAGNRFLMDCPEFSNWTGLNNDPVATCNAYIESQPDVLDEAYWRIRGVYVYERSKQVANRIAATNSTSRRHRT